MKSNIIFIIIFIVYCVIANAQDTVKVSEIDSAEFRILTAGSLNFYGTQQFSRYVGQIDIRLPSLVKIKILKSNTMIGFNIGVFTKNYYSDSLFRGIGKFNVRNTNDTLNYNVKTINRYSRIVYDVYGAYFNPTFFIKSSTTNEGGQFRLYLNASLEVLSTTAKTNYRYNLVDSTIHRYNNTVTADKVLSDKDPRIVQPNATENWITGFYGLGPQLYYKQKNLLDLNILFIGGYSITSYNGNGGSPLYSETLHSRQLYYLAKGVVTERITKLNATIGLEIRGMYPDRTPSIAAYLGFIVTPSAFF